MKANSPMQCSLDHLVVCAQSCEAGVQWLEQLAGVVIPIGGKHPLMGTHNHLSALSANSFLEIIAIDPGAGPVSRPRWFRLDDVEHRRRLQRRPSLTTWVAGTSDLAAAMAAAASAGVDVGNIVTLTRGNLTWQIALQTDGSLACGGMFPILIQWPDGVNPVDQMQDQGLRLDGLRLTHPEPAFLQKALQSIGADGLVVVESGGCSIRADMSVGTQSFQISN